MFHAQSNSFRPTLCRPMTAAALVFAACATAASAQSIINLGVPDGASGSGASAVSANGAVIAANTDMQSAHRWTLSGFTNLLMPDGASAASADDISYDGSAIAGGLFFVTPEETARAYRWTAATGMQDLGVLPGHFASFASGISGDGSIVAGTSLDADYNSTAFRWTSQSGMQALGHYAGATASSTHAISGDGSTIVGYATTSNGDRAFAWTESTGMQELALLTLDDTWSSAFGASDNGSRIVGFSGNHAVMWANGTPIDLGVLPSDTDAVAYAISGDGSLVGGSSFTGFSNVRATLWSEALGLVDLNEYLPTLGIDLTGWQLTYTRDISFDGTTIVGEGVFEGQFRGWAVTIPSPTVPTILGLGAVFTSRRRRA